MFASMHDALEAAALAATDALFRVPPRSALDRYLGPHEGCYIGYASDGRFRQRAASGGVVTAILADLLQRGVVQGALVSRLAVGGGRITAEPFIARTPADVLTAQSSIYFEFPLVQAIRELALLDGSYAVVGLPCHLHALRQLEARDEHLSGKIGIRIGLVCGRNLSRAFLPAFLHKNGIRADEISAFRYREGHWRGHMGVTLTDGRDIRIPFGRFSVYRNLHLFCARKCLFCDDPLAGQSDITCGDAWLAELRSHPIKHSLVVARSSRGDRQLQAMCDSGSLTLARIPEVVVFRAQRRNLIPMRRGQTAIRRLARPFGFTAPRGSDWVSRWNDYIVAAMILAATRISHSKRLAPLVLALPRPVLQIFLSIIAFLKSF